MSNLINYRVLTAKDGLISMKKPYDDFIKLIKIWLSAKKIVMLDNQMFHLDTLKSNPITKKQIINATTIILSQEELIGA